MKNLISILFACVGFVVLSSFQVEDVVTLVRVDPYVKIFRESTYFPEMSATEEVAAGEHAVFQFAMRGNLYVQDAQVSIDNLTNEKGAQLTAIKTGFVGYVHVGRPTPKRSRDALNSLSGYYPDPIMEQTLCDVPRDQTQPIWITVTVPQDAKPGLYKGKVCVTGFVHGESFELTREISLRVYPVVMDAPSLWVTNWFTTNDKVLRLFNGGKEMERYSDLYWQFVQVLADKMKECYQNTVIISPFEYTEFTLQNDKYTFDFSHFDKMIETFQQAGVLKMLEIGHIAGRSGNWDSQFVMMVPEQVDGEQVIKRYPVESVEAQRFYKQYMPALLDHLKAKGWDNYCMHIADEPTSVNVGSYISIAKFIKQLAPKAKLIEACHSHDLEGVLDIWVPELDFYHEGYDFYKGRQAKGDEVWFYTCLAPQGEYANRFIELPLIKTRMLHWVNYRYGATGYLHWGFNFWWGNPYEETTSINTESGNVLPGGDSWIVYPANGKLNGSIRLEAMRDGIADYTLLQMLGKKNPELARELCRQVVYDWELYDMDVNNFRAIRHRILEELGK